MHVSVWCIALEKSLHPRCGRCTKRMQELSGQIFVLQPGCCIIGVCMSQRRRPASGERRVIAARKHYVMLQHPFPTPSRDFNSQRNASINLCASQCGQTAQLESLTLPNECSCGCSSLLTAAMRPVCIIMAVGAATVAHRAAHRQQTEVYKPCDATRSYIRHAT